MSGFNPKKLQSMTKQSEVINQASEPDSAMAGMLELSDQGIKTTIDLLKVLMEKVDNIQEQMGNISREMKTKN